MSIYFFREKGAREGGSEGGMCDIAGASFIIRRLLNVDAHQNVDDCIALLRGNPFKTCVLRCLLHETAFF